MGADGSPPSPLPRPRCVLCGHEADAFIKSPQYNPYCADFVACDERRGLFPKYLRTRRP